MAIFSDMSSGARRVVLSITMLVILLLLTGAAWLITRTRSGSRPGEQWYLVLSGSEESLGWKAAARSSTQQGSNGYDVLNPVRGDGSEGIEWSQWRLNKDATQGLYFSYVPKGKLRNAQVVYQVTTVSYQGDRVLVTQRKPVGGVVLKSERAFLVDENYLPEGTLQPAIVRVARSGKAEQRTKVADEIMALVDVSLEPQEFQELSVGRSKVSVKPVRVTQSLNGQPFSEDDYFVDSDGEIIRVQNLSHEAKEIYQLVDYQLILQKFPEAPGERSAALSHRGLP